MMSDDKKADKLVRLFSNLVSDNDEQADEIAVLKARVAALEGALRQIANPVGILDSLREIGGEPEHRQIVAEFMRDIAAKALRTDASK